MDHMTYPQPGVEHYPEPERTSVTAVLGFILSILGCCLMGLPALIGVPLCVFALVAIGRSNGRLGGRGLAVAGLVVGLISLIVYVSLTVLTSTGLRSGVLEPVERMFVSIESGDFDAFRAEVGPPASDVTDAEIIAFRAAYQDALGGFVSAPDGMVGYLGGLFELGPIMQAAQGHTSGPPVPVAFDAGGALVLIQMDQTTGRISSLRLVDMNQNEYTLPMQPGWDEADPRAEPGDTPGDGPDAEPGPDPDAGAEGSPGGDEGEDSP